MSAFQACTLCGCEKSLEQFSRSSISPTGFNWRCKECMAAYRRKWNRENKERIRVYNSEYNDKNRERNAAIQADWRATHPESVQASRAKWAKNNPEKIKANALRQLERRKARTQEKHNGTWGPKETDDGRRCTGCRRRKTRELFPPNAGSPDGFGTYCRECTNRKARENAAKPAVQEYRRNYMRALALKKYGMTLDDFDAKVAEQDGKCAICRDPLRFGTGGCGVDHDHRTGDVRGILCRLCNVGVGHFRENTELFLRAVQYLSRKEDD